MKKLLTLLCILISCKKDPIVIQVGRSYYIKSNIFNKGVYQPAQPVLVDSLYMDTASGLPYAKIKDTQGTEWFIPQEDLK